MAYWDFARTSEGEFPGLCVAFSPDGIHWTKHAEAPLLKGGYTERGVPVAFAGNAGRSWDVPLSISDAMDVIYDPQRDKFVIYHKMWIDGPNGTNAWKHVMGRTESQDFIHWSRPELMMAPDDADPPTVEFHHSPVFYYNDRYFSLLQILNRGERGGVIDVELALSRDGLTWRRPFRRDYFLPRNKVKVFDSGNLTTNGTPIFLDDEFRFYYGGGSEGATSQDIYAVESGIGLATMPRDRFASLRPSGKIAQVTTKPVEVGPDTKITMNADATRGAIFVELLDEDGHRLPGFTKDEAVKISGDSLAHAVRWRQTGLRSLSPRHYMLRLHLADQAEVFAAELTSAWSRSNR
jgi:hypothetical protein